MASLAACYARADEGHGGQHHSPAGQNHADHPRANHTAHHGGQVSATRNLCFEVVYQPREARVYLYDHNQEQLSMRGVSGEATMQIRGNEKMHRLPARYVAAKDLGDHDFLSVSADVRQVRDGDMTVAFTLKNLPSAAEPSVRFTQTFALSTASPSVKIVPLSDADRAGISHQAVCPVTETKLGIHGTPVKMAVGDRSMFVCCKGCIGKVQKEPETYLAKLGASPSN